jgi:hypothetical protein
MKPYVIRRLRPSAFVPLLGSAAIVAFVIAFDFAWWFAAAAAAIALFEAWRATLVLRVDAKGVRIGQRPNRRIPQPFVPWTSIQEVALTESDPPEIAVRLKHGAPLPRGVDAAIHDPSQTTVAAPRLRMPVHRADRSALTAAVQGFGGIPLRSA